MTVTIPRTTFCALLAVGACARAPLVEERAGIIVPASVPAVTVRELPLSTTSDLARSHFLLGERLLDAGRPQLASAHFRSAVAEDPSFAYAWVSLAVSAQSAREFKESLDMAARRLAGASVAESVFVRIGRTFLDNDLEERLELSQALTRAYPDVARSWLVLGNAHVALNRHADARRAYRRAIELDPRLFAAHAALATSHLFGEPRDRDVSLQSARQTIASAATVQQRARGYELLGDVHRSASRRAEARDAYGRATAEDATHAVATLKKGHIESFLGAYDEARAAYDAALAGAQGGQKVVYANYRAFARAHADDPRGAIAELRAAAATADAVGVPAAEVPGLRAFTFANAATIGLHHDLVDEAARDVADLAAAMRADAAATRDTAYARQQEAAILLWEGRLAARRGEGALARRKAEEHRALVAADRNPRRLEGYHALLGLVAMREHDAVTAAAEYREADLTDDYVRYQLALALEAAGQTDDARRLFREVAEWNFNSVGFALSRREAMRRGGVMTMR